MTLSKIPVMKRFIALWIGLPGTLVYGPMAAFGLWFGSALALDSAARLGNGVDGSYVPAWAAAGLVGLCGFWLWVFSSNPMSKARRATIGGMVLAGVFAAGPLALWGSGWYSALAGLGCMVGISICLWLALPNLPLNPDTRQEPRAR